MKLPKRYEINKLTAFLYRSRKKVLFCSIHAAVSCFYTLKKRVFFFTRPVISDKNNVYCEHIISVLFYKYIFSGGTKMKAR